MLNYQRVCCRKPSLFTGWWCNNHLEPYGKSMDIMEKKCSKPPTSLHISYPIVIPLLASNFAPRIESKKINAVVDMVLRPCPVT